jgi:hypothetical protein
MPLIPPDALETPFPVCHFPVSMSRTTTPAAEESHRLKGDRTGQALVAALQASPCRDIEIEPRRERAPMRSVEL